jgi:two-component system phosphate regulon sensor histidine kinase PhoR
MQPKEALLQELAYDCQPAELNLNEVRLNALLTLSQMSEKNLLEAMDFGLEEAIRLTASKIGYIYYYDEQTELFTLCSWSDSVMAQCTIVEKQTLYELRKTGLWGEAIRQRKPIITNDYNASHPYRKGYPEGHVHLIRHMNLPVVVGKKIVAVIGVGNKETDYTENDVAQLQLFMGSLWNIIEKKRMEEELRRSNDNILNMLKVMSHDIRSPLASMAATLRLLERGSYGGMDESVANTVKDLSIRVRQLLGIAEDCLGKASAVDAQMKIEKRDIDLRQEVIDSVLDELSNEIEAKGIIIDNRLGAIPTGTITVNASKLWLKVVYRNLFQNAIKYGGQGCTIAFGYEDHGSIYRLNVYNTGEPIPEEKRSILFTKFGRVQGDMLREGSGMGLYLTKEIITRHGGNIWYEARHTGNDFVFTLPK